MERSSARSRVALAAAGLFLAANVVVPAIWGDVYPFTSAPMFREAPPQCCQYRVFDAAGQELPAENWLLQRVYDGNPVGYGVGLRPPEVLEQEFGVIPQEPEVRWHVERRFEDAMNRGCEQVEVERAVIGAIERGRVGGVEVRRWTVSKPVGRTSE